jgi:hypothetical protein
MDREKFVDILILVIIAAVGLFTAYLTFGILSSQASAQIQQYSVGGAIAGALVSWGVLGSLYGQFRQSSEKFRQLQESNAKLQEILQRGDQLKQLQDANIKLQDVLQRGDELKELRKRNEELQQKLIRGTPRPDEYEIEISDREKIVLARPSKWRPKGGIIFEFEMPAPDMRKGDVFPAQFRVSYVQIDDSTGPADEVYRNFETVYANPDYYGGYTSEYIDIGGEPYGIRSLKVIVLEYYRVEVVEDPKIKIPKFNVSILTQREYNDALQPPPTTAATPTAEPQETAIPSIPDTEAQKVITTAEPTPVTDGATQTGKPVDGATTPGPTSNEGDAETTAQPKIFYDRVMHMAVACYNKSLGTIYFFDFWDDINDFTEMSAHFNQVLRSTRFLT